MLLHYTSCEVYPCLSFGLTESTQRRLFPFKRSLAP